MIVLSHEKFLNIMSLAKKINLRKDEEIILVVKAFFFTYIWLYLFGFLFMGVTSFFMFWLFANGVWGYVVYGLGMILGLYVIFRTWYFSSKNFSVITTERLVDVNRIGWFDEYLSTIHFGDILDVYVRKQGLWSNLLNFGSVFIETPELEPLRLVNIKSPQRVLELVLEYKNNLVNKKNLQSQESIYKAFVKNIPYMDEAQLCEVRDLIDTQLDLIDEK